MSTSKPYTAILVSQTHWDRAWYQPFQIFRMRLVRLIDRLLDLLQQDPTYHSFMLDGQLLPVEDYLEIRPERRETLRRLVQEGRLFVGPWYALADEYLVSPEALIRNLAIGMELTESLGGVMCEGYVPDSFGHIAQLPQILHGFDIDSVLFWRGVGDEGERLGGQFWWEAPDGSRAFAIHLRDGYHNAANLGYYPRWGDPGVTAFDMELACRRLRDAVDYHKTYNHSDTILLLNGVDHADADANVPRVIACANERFEDVQIVHGTLPDYVARVRATAHSSLPTFRGEFNRSRYTYALQGVYSSRMYLQQANERAQTLLEVYAEPLSSWAWLLGQPYPSAFLQLAWRKLIQNHPHDDICGCSVDEVHRENMARFGEVEQIARSLVVNSWRAIVARIDRTAQPGVPFVLFNPVAHPRAETVEVELIFDEEDSTAQDFHLVTAGGQAIPVQRLDETTFLDAGVGRSNPMRRVRVALSVRDLPACGYRVLYAQPRQPVTPPHIADGVQRLSVKAGMENSILRVEIGADGTLDVLDKRSGRWFKGLGYFSDDEDAGDEYDYSPCLESQRFDTRGQQAQIRLLHEGPLQVTYEIVHDFKLPASLSDDRQRRAVEQVRCPITTTVTLRQGSPRLDVRTTVDNRAKDHRLRVCFPSGVDTELSVADGHFDVVERDIELPDGDGWDQPPSSTKHQRYFVDLSDGEQGLAILNRGLAEYEILRDGRNTIAVTLLRCVGYLSRGDMLSRRTHAGPGLPTPEAQCQGVHTFEYAIVPHPGDWRTIYREAYDFRAPVIVWPGREQVGYFPGVAEREKWDVSNWQAPVLTGDLPAELSFLTLEPDTVAVSAIKQSETGDRLVVRCYNPTADAVEATVRLFRPIQAAHLLKLSEVQQKPLAVQDGTSLSMTVGGKQIRTIGLQLAPEAKA